ncbi:rhodanese-like domain-containing protein [Methylomicrobium sp. Wu6]|uniref:rhodanese-like domain-containing protein n=1 Tax=Methylomicrobium sp. Wu6 TaxID=3107928 RepID=UPI002DD629FC|nr:rhodanese-like domain-containing protein [Methylomicrobium sp. Wu6]MEC4749713.1 rhodanese-like domain-containing protein [Methylomicrobium sp. Wu6]
MQRLFEFIFNHYVYSLALAVVTYLLIQEFFDTAFKKFNPITPMLAVAKMNESDIQIIDVREAPDYAQGYIEKAINAPLSKLSEQLPKLTSDKKAPLLVVCQNGTRSLTAAKTLAKAGFEQIFVITGGMDAWTEDYKLPITTQRKQKASV